MAKKKSPLRDELRSRIRKAGLRSTMARVTVLERLHEATTPLSHADLAAELSPQGFDKATIYRNLVELAEAGMLRRVELGDHLWRFELIREEDEHSAEHPHFVCVDCGEVACLPGASVNVAEEPGRRSKIGDVTQVLLKGHCERCV
jgi:Fur family ferric uptake transcriptional regulator